MQINDVLKALKHADPTMHMQVRFDFAGCVPTTVESWRGIYAEPALGWKPTGYSSGKMNKIPTCASLIAEIERAISGRTYIGWKGGEFTFSANDTLHIDNPGDYTNTEITHIVADRYGVIICTKHDDEE